MNIKMLVQCVTRTATRFDHHKRRSNYQIVSDVYFNTCSVAGRQIRQILNSHVLWHALLSTLGFLSISSPAFADLQIAQANSGIAVLTGPDTRIVRKFPHEKAVSAIAWSADGKLLATLSNFFRDVVVWDVSKGERLYELHLEFPFSNVLTFTPDGKYLLTGPDKDVSRAGHTSATLWDMSTGRVAREIDGPFPDRQLTDNIAEAFAFSHDGKLLALISQKAPSLPFALYKTDDWTIVAMISIPRDTPNVLAFSPDNQSFAVGTVRGKVTIFDASRHTLTGTIDAYDQISVLALCYSPDGKFIASGNGIAPKVRQPDGTWKDLEPPNPIRIWNAASGALVRSYAGKLSKVYALSWDPNDRSLVSAAGDRTVRSWGVGQTDEERTLLTFFTPSMGVAFGPDGRVAAIGDNLAVIATISH